MKLFLSDLISANDSAAICRSAPVTPPTARQQMITKARTQDEAARRMEDATASHMHGSDTPPGAFAADDAVTQFRGQVAIHACRARGSGLGSYPSSYEDLTYPPPLGCDHSTCQSWGLHRSCMTKESPNEHPVLPRHTQSLGTLIKPNTPHAPNCGMSVTPDSPYDLKSPQLAPVCNAPTRPLLHAEFAPYGA